MAVGDITRSGDDHEFDRVADDAMAGVFIHDDTDSRAAIVHVFGESTFADTEALAELILRVIRIGRAVVVDMRECAYMDCATIGVFVRVAKMLGDQLRLVVPRHSQGYRMLDLTGLARVLHVFDSIDEAVAPLALAPRARLRIVSSITRTLTRTLAIDHQYRHDDRHRSDGLRAEQRAVARHIGDQREIGCVD